MSAPIPFVKMSGAGNDFVVLDAATWERIPEPRAVWVRGVCRRGLSVGADGVLVVAARGADRVRLTFFNPDGGEAFCGNGTRCAARYAVVRKLVAGPSLTIETSGGTVPARVDGSSVTLDLTPPEDLGAVTLALDEGSAEGRLVRAGVPHLVLAVDDVAAYPLERVGPRLRRHPALGVEGANVNVVAPAGTGRVRVRTFERGVEAETLSCGTGAIAAAFVTRREGGPESLVVLPSSGIPLRVDLPGDRLRPERVRLSGDARFVFDGSLGAEGIVEEA